MFVLNCLGRDRRLCLYAVNNCDSFLALSKFLEMLDLFLKDVKLSGKKNIESIFCCFSWSENELTK